MNARPFASRWIATRASLAVRLESNGSPGPVTRLLASGWGALSARGIARPLVLPEGVRAIGVGGASLGGSFKTPFAIALARALAARGLDVALVGHAYRARPGTARIVRTTDEVAEVGDDALWAAQSLAGSGVDVIVGPSRQAAVTFAARRARCLVFDGLLQARPQRLARSILLLDGSHPWQRAHCPPAGDLRAPRHALLGAADLAVVVDDALAQADAISGFVGDAIAEGEAISDLERARCADGSAVPLSELRGTALGLVLAIARPGRVVEALARRGVHPVTTVAFPDHHRPSSAELAAVVGRTTHRIEAWLTTGKCATKLPPSLAGAPVLILEQVVRLSDRLASWAAADDPERLFDFPSVSAHALFPTAGAVG